MKKIDETVMANQKLHTLIELLIKKHCITKEELKNEAKKLFGKVDWRF